MAKSKRPLISINPLNGETLKTFHEMSREELDKAIGRADNAFGEWSARSFSERASILKRASELFEQRSDTLARLMAQEMGKKLSDGLGELALCAEIFDYYAEEGENILAPQQLSTREGEGTLVFQPLGVVYGIQPWNFPFYQPSRFTAANLIAGNVVLTKHASNVPQCAEAFEQLLFDAGVPKGVYTNLPVTSAGAAPIIDDDRVKGISFTGSNAAGAKVAEQAGRNVKKTVMELGGVDPFIVLEDADMDLTVERFVEGKLGNCGQICLAAKRIILTEPIADEFLGRVTKLFKQLKPGDPLKDTTDYGPLCTEKAAEHLEEQVSKSVKAGAHLLVGGKRNGAFVEPGILTDIPEGSPAAEEELFGPIACVWVVKDEKAAIEMANDSRFGLGGSVYTKDHARGQRVAEKLECGTAFVNHVASSYASMPMGGVKKSGYGRELGELGIKEFVNQKLIRHFN
ncbi:NAD-dependent succinate-semialdehyde dehydrogenase [Microbulbifer variabilis]|uniref:NAD-dependent succinate-semialdehyde dehydrogenase n=1 Tax=Microbulbifer variabilis TaxID=266805 RepID=UPI001CFC67D0|nr:NAD-dependent succinate-semialdehyde dehydrogenase [Microbulbifer variabilis]